MGASYGMTDAQRATAARLEREGFQVGLQSTGFYLAKRGADQRCIRPDGSVGRAFQTPLNGYARAHNFGGRK